MKPSIITISRQYGSGGRTIGALLSERLAIPVYDKAQFSEAAQRSGIRPSRFAEAELRGGDQLFDPSFDGFTSASSLNDRMFLAQVETMRKLAEKDPCIIVGRGANRILKDRKDLLNIFLYADLAVRIRRAVEEYGIDPEDVEKVVRDMDKNRTSYLKAYTNQQFGKVENYHLCINSGAVGLENTAKIIHSTYRALQ